MVKGVISIGTVLSENRRAMGENFLVLIQEGKKIRKVRNRRSVRGLNPVIIVITLACGLKGWNGVCLKEDETELPLSSTRAMTRSLGNLQMNSGC